jgi:hypothetical protein
MCKIPGLNFMAGSQRSFEMGWTIMRGSMVEGKEAGEAL